MVNGWLYANSFSGKGMFPELLHEKINVAAKNIAKK